MVQPINYLQQVAAPFENVLQGVKIGAGMAELELAQQQREQAQRQQQMLAEAQSQFFANPRPTMRDALQFASMLPKDRADAIRPYIENFNKEQQQAVLKTNGQMLAALQTNPPLGVKMMRDYAAAQRNAGDMAEAALYDGMADAAEDPARGPATAFKALTTATAQIPGAKETFESIDKALSIVRSEQMQPAAQRKAVAEADEAVAKATSAQAAATTAAERAAADLALSQAQAQKAAVEAQYAEQIQIAGLNEKNWNIKNLQSQISERAEKLNLDRQVTQATVAEKLSSIQAKLTEIPADTRKLINDAAVTAATAKQTAAQLNDLSNRIQAAGGGWGAFTSLADAARRGLGFQNGATQLRQEYIRLRNSAAIKSLPPGPATDRDIELALRGFPPENADAGTVASFLRGMAKLQDVEASVANAKTDWLANNNGTLTRARNAFIAGDYTTKPGESFNDFTQRVVADVNRRYSSTGQSPLVEQIPTPRNPTPGAAQANIRSQADAILRGGQ